MPHLSLLEEGGLIRIHEEQFPKGKQKCCFLDAEADQILVDVCTPGYIRQTYRYEIPVGGFSDFDVASPCGLAADSSFLGQLDQPRYFGHPDRGKARIVWFTTGYLEYVLPNFIPNHSQIEEITLSFEIGSEAPGWNDVWPSDISFLLNGVRLGTWTSPGDFGSRRGKLNPEWWYPFLNQYGCLKTLTIDGEGTFLDGEKLSDISAGQLLLTDQSVLKFRFEVSPDATHPGGCTLYGLGFGDYNQGIRMSIGYRTDEC